MAITVVDDFTTINTCDALDVSRFNAGTGVNNPNTADTDIKVQGSASWRARVTGASLGGFGDDFGSASSLVGGDHVMIWCRTLDLVTVTDGWRMRHSTGTDTESNYREISVGGFESSRNVVAGFFNFCGDPLFPQMNQVGTPPTLANVRSFSLLANHTTSSGRDTMFMDEIKHGTGVTITGGAAAPRGSVEIASNDNTNGRGTFSDINGVYYILGRITIGDITAAVNSTFEDSNKIWVFQTGSFGPSFHKVEFVGGTGTNAATFGSVSGTGVAQVGSGGNTMLSSGIVPFHIIATDADINVGLYGCVFLGPTARYSAPCRAVVEGTTSDQTFAASNTVDSDANLLPATQAANSACNFGSEVRFGELSIDAAALATGTWTLTWEYWNGASWASLTDVTDGTVGFRTAGEQTVDFSIPDDWATTTINSQGPFYYIRARISSFTSSGVQPTADFIRIHQDGLIELEQANASMISSTVTNIGSIRLRSVAFLKKTTVTGSIAPAKHAAIDLGSADPAADTFRDMTISDNANTNGILLKGTSTGTTTYNFRNIQMSGNLKDIRVDFPAGATININVLENSKIFVAGDIDNVNASTVNIVANTQVTFAAMKDNSEIRVYDSGTGVEIAGIEDATAGTLANRNVVWSDSAGNTVVYVIHNFQVGDEIYETIRVNNFVIPSTDITLNIAQRIDRNAEN